MRTVLFVCTGNTCRSPMAEAIARHAVEGGLLEGMDADDMLFISAGLVASDGMPASPEVTDVLERKGIHGFESRSLGLSPQMVEKADLVLAMTGGHLEGIRSLVGGDAEKVSHVHLLDPQGDVRDPIGGGLDVYEATATQMENVIPARLKEFLQ
jgi:protein-tyrosine-phosphatase